jgi:hypothetical protein
MKIRLPEKFSREAQPNTTVTKLGAPPPPSNSELMELAKKYSPKLYESLESKIPKTRNFWLTEIFPPALASFNAGEDANEVVMAALESDPQIRGLLQAAQGYVNLGLRIKILRHVSDSLNLSPLDSQLLTQLVFLPKEQSIKDLLLNNKPHQDVNPLTEQPRKKKKHGDDIEERLPEVRKVHDLQGFRKGSRI